VKRQFDLSAQSRYAQARFKGQKFGAFIEAEEHGDLLPFSSIYDCALMD
jgi:hypothetical protein